MTEQARGAIRAQPNTDLFVVSPVAPPPPLGPGGSPGAGPGSGADELPIDIDLIKVLASDSRRDILRLLGERRKTLTELAQALGLKKATVLEHLKKLQEANLIKRLDEDDRLWIYYELSPRGKRLVHPGRTRFYLIMAGSVLALVTLAALVVAATMLGAPGPSSGPGEGAEDGAAQSPVLFGDGRGAVPPVVWRGFDADVPITLPSTPPGAQLVVGDPTSPAALVPASDGKAYLSAQTIDALPTGRHALALDTDAGLLALGLVLDVRDPPLALLPAAVPENATTRIRLSAGEDGLPAPTVRAVEVDGETLAVDADGAFTLGVRPAGEVQVRAGRLATLRLAILPEIPFAWSGDNGTLVLATIPGAEARLDGVPLGFANETGGLRVAWPSPGEHALRLVAPDGRAQERAFAATADALTPLAPRLALSAYHGGGPQVLTAHVDVRNGGPANETVTLTATIRGRVVASTVVDAPAGGSAIASLRAEVRTDAPVEIEAFAARSGLSSVRFAAYDADDAGGAEEGDASAAPVAAAPHPAAGGQTASPATPTVPASSAPSSARLDMGDLAAAPPDARVTLPPLTPATPEGAAMRGSGAEPAVPGPGTAVILAAVAVAALAFSRRRAARRP